jgi:hypothetical protein
MGKINSNAQCPMPSAPKKEIYANLGVLYYLVGIGHGAWGMGKINSNAQCPMPSAPKKEIYANLGLLYYLVYNPQYWRRDRQQSFELYRLVSGSYQLQIGEPFWMPEIGLGIGRVQLHAGGLEREVLCWYDRQGTRYLTPSEAEQQARRQLEIERRQLELAQQQLERSRQLFGELPEE